MNIKKYGSKPMNLRIAEKLSQSSVGEPLTEDVNNEVGEAATVSSMISALIQQEWEICDAINGNLIFAQEVNDSELEGLLNDLLTDHYMHIGQLEARVQAVVPEADAIEDGKGDESLRPKFDEDSEDELLDDIKEF